MMPTARRRFVQVFALAVLPALAGCREDWQATVYPATGRLTVNGQPATGALVQLVADGPGPDVRESRPWGMVGADGAFTLSTYEGEAGAPAGTYRVAITWPVDAGIMGSPDRLKGKFADARASAYPVTIRAEATTIPPIELTNVAVAANPRPSAAAARHLLPR